MSLLQLPLNELPLSHQFKSLTLSNPFLHGSSSLSQLSKPTSFNPSFPAFLTPIRAMKTMQGRVVCATNDKTVSVVVVRLASEPKYIRRVRKKKKYQAHDPLNQFKVGDRVMLEKCRPISKTKSFLAVPVPARTRPEPKEKEENQELGLPLESAKIE